MKTILYIIAITCLLLSFNVKAQPSYANYDDCVQQTGDRETCIDLFATPDEPAQITTPDLSSRGYKYLSQGILCNANKYDEGNKELEECINLCDSKDDCHGFLWSAERTENGHPKSCYGLKLYNGEGKGDGECRRLKVYLSGSFLMYLHNDHLDKWQNMWWY